MSWTDDRVGQLKKLWTDGLSASQIAAQLGGVTRNAVIGKVHRLGLSGRGRPTSTASRSRKPKAKRRLSPAVHSSDVNAIGSRRVSSGGRGGVSIGATALKADEKLNVNVLALPELAEELVIPEGERTDILALNESTCRWPIGDPLSEDFHFCGRDCSDNDGPYCNFHSRIAYQKTKRG